MLADLSHYKISVATVFEVIICLYFFEQLPFAFGLNFVIRSFRMPWIFPHYFHYVVFCSKAFCCQQKSGLFVNWFWVLIQGKSEVLVHGVTTQKKRELIFTTMKIWNLWFGVSKYTQDVICMFQSNWIYTRYNFLQVMNTKSEGVTCSLLFNFDDLRW
jgi:hypothetical protein